MKIQELFHLDKALAEKKQELEKLRQEAEELKLMIEINNKEISKDLIDITNVYVYQKARSNVKLFVEKKEKRTDFFPLRLVNIFSSEEVTFCKNSEFMHSQHPGLWPGHNFFTTHIKEAYPEVNVYPDNMVPKVLLQKLYYRANGIDEKVLKRGALKEE